MTKLEAAFLLLCRAHGLPEPVPQYRIAPDRRYRWDWAWPDGRVKCAVECQGGTWVYGMGHSRGSGIRRDVDKANLATSLGWRVYYVTTDSVREGAADVMDALKRDLAR